MSRSRDNRMIRLGHEFAIIEEMLRASNHSSIADEAREEMSDHWWAVVRQIIDTPAATLRGMRVKAAALVAVHRMVAPPASPFVDLAISIAHDLGRQN
jgi:hypothetical protein